MRDPTVYDLLQTQKGDRQVARLIHALDELAGRLESVSGYDAISQQLGGLQLAAGTTGLSLCSSKVQRPCRSGTWDLKAVQLPNPAAGPLPLFPGGSEFNALQSAATQTAGQLRSKAERHAWRSWVMAPSHLKCVIHAAWLLLALVFKQEDTNAKTLQDFVFQELAQHYVSQVLTGQTGIDNASLLWTQAIADAACRLLRSAFPGNNELQDPQLQQLLQRQLRLWTTGVLPSDAASALLAPQVQDDDNDTIQATSERYTAAPFVSIKPGPLVSSYMASRGLKPVDLLHKQGPKVKNLTVPHGQLQQQQQQQQAPQQHGKQPLARPRPPHLQSQPQTEAVEMSSSKSPNLRPVKQKQQRQQEVGHKQQPLETSTVMSRLHPLTTEVTQQGTALEQEIISSSAARRQATAASISAAHASASSTLQGSTAAGGTAVSYTAKAAACLAAAVDAAEQYERSKKASTAAVGRGSKVVQQDLRLLQQKRHDLLFGTRAKAQSASNSLSGWLGDSAAGTTTTTSATATDAQCKAQRQLMESQLRGTDWRMTRAFNAAVHDKCLDIAATVAAAAPAAADAWLHGSDSSAAGANVVGGQWAAIAGNSMTNKRLGLFKGASAACSGSHDVKVMKAARAIVEDVQRKFAAAPIRLTKRM